MCELPLISLVTVVYNGAEHLEQTIQSITNQTYPNFEYVIIDGGSTDRTLDIINQYQQHLTYWISEADSGIADAMNKGIQQTRGDYILFIHADDKLIDSDVLSRAVQQFDDRHDIFAFSIQYGSNPIPKISRGFSFWINLKTGVFHQGAICRRRLFDQIGCFDTRFKIAMDYDWFLRAYRICASLKFCSGTITHMGDNGVSSKTDRASLLRRLNEERLVHKKNCNSLFLKMLYKIYWLVYPPYKLNVANKA